MGKLSFVANKAGYSFGRAGLVKFGLFIFRKLCNLLWYTIFTEYKDVSMDTELMTVGQTASYMQLSEKTIRRLIKQGLLPAARIGARSLRIRFADVERYVNDTTVLMEPLFRGLRSNEEKELAADAAPLVEPVVGPVAELVLADVVAAANNGPRMVSLFAGCGGLNLGFIEAGFNIVWANDFDADAQAVYALNLGSVDGRDIRIVGENEIPDCDILTAGFPCQPFSNAGNRRGVNDSRGMLYKECLRFIEHKMPKVIVFENVKGLLSTKYIDGRNLGVLKQIT